MASTTWRGHLSFGLVSIPLKLYPAARAKRVEFHQVHRVCRTRLRRPLFCPTCNRIVKNDEVVKGYEFEKGQYLLLEDQEIRKLEPETGGTMEITEFVPLEEVDPLYFESSYLGIPDPSGAKAYRLLVEALDRAAKVGLAKVAMHQREYLVIIRARDKGLTLHTMYFADEIREVADYGHVGAPVKPQEMKLAAELIESLSAHFKPEKYKDDYRERVQALVDAKLKGRKTPVAAERKPAPVIDMMEALKRSLAKRGHAAARPAAQHAAKTRRKAS
jgi:DNA end-binding protein Ku